jgi:hypothetical protein
VLSSSHSPIATEVAFGARLLLFRPAVLQVLRSALSAQGFPARHFIARPSCCPFSPAVRQRIRGRSVIQVFAEGFPEDSLRYQFNSGPKPICFLNPCDPVVKERFRFRRPAEHRVSPLVQASALLVRRPGGLTEPCRASFK